MVDALQRCREPVGDTQRFGRAWTGITHRTLLELLFLVRTDHEKSLKVMKASWVLSSNNHVIKCQTPHHQKSSLSSKWREYNVDLFTTWNSFYVVRQSKVSTAFGFLRRLRTKMQDTQIEGRWIRYHRGNSGRIAADFEECNHSRQSLTLSLEHFCYSTLLLVWTSF